MRTQQLLPLFSPESRIEIRPFRRQLLKWIGNKQRFAHEIAAYFPARFGTYFEPFLGSGAVLGTLAPQSAFGSDGFLPLIEIWRALKDRPNELKQWYAERCERLRHKTKEDVYEEIKASYNSRPNGCDLVFLCRSCYGGVVRFRKADGFMSTPCGVHHPISPTSFNRRVDEWRQRCQGSQFVHSHFVEMMERAEEGDLIYCDPPYADSQTILYGAQSFNLPSLFEAVARCKSRGVFVAVSIDGTKRSGDKVCELQIPDRLFETEAMVNCGRSMLRRFQMSGQTLESEAVADRLLLTYSPDRS
ncbi:MAG TPA: Dam family site-specific DNA-(adenine-N6)-methyltransferase [Pirellulales bacterium]